MLSIKKLVLVTLLIGLCHAAAYGTAAYPTERPNILLIVSEDNGPELGCYGDPYAQTPVLDQLASDGVLFENAFVPFSVCSPSRACFLTGLYPHQNGQLGLATHKFEMFDGTKTMPSVLQRAGYRTGMIGKLHVNPSRDFPFDFRKITGANFNKRNMREYADAAAEFFREESEQPFFLSINYPDAHFPLLRQQFGLPKEPIESDEVRPLPWVGVDSARLRQFTADYYNCMRRLDDGIGMLLEELSDSGHAENTLVIYIGDHGAQFSRGKCSVYEGGLRIPMIVRWPNHHESGLKRDELVSTLDLMPTVIQAAGIDSGRELPGRPLQALLLGEPTPDSWRKHIVGITTGAAPALFYFQQSIRNQRYKLISSPLSESDRSNRFAQCYLTQYNVHFAAGCTADEIASAPSDVQAAYERFLHPPRFELYDLEVDPFEFHDLSGSSEHLAIKEQLIQALEDWQDATSDPFADIEKLRRFAASQIEAIDTNYRGNREFRWAYLDELGK